MPFPDYILETISNNVSSTEYLRVDTTTCTSATIKPSFNEVYEYYIKPIKDDILMKDPSAIFQIEELNSKRSKVKILVKLTGSSVSAETLSLVDKNYSWNGKYYVYCFKCKSLDISDTIESYDEHIETISINKTSTTIYKKITTLDKYTADI